MRLRKQAIKIGKNEEFQLTVKRGYGENRYNYNTDKSFYFSFKHSETKSPLKQQQYVKGKLKTLVLDLKAPKILETIELGYKLPLVDTPERKFSGNNKAAFENEEFISEKTQQLIKDDFTVQVGHISHVVRPKSVNTDRASKKRLILDLR